MKYTFFNKSGFNALLFAAVLLTTSCESELAEPTADAAKVAYVALHNFTLGDTTSVFVNNTRLALGGANVALPVNVSLLGNYIGVNPGDVTVAARTIRGTANYASRTVNVAQTTYTSFFTYDTLNSSGTAKMLVLTNNMKAADTATSNIRFLHLSPTAGTISVMLTRTSNQFGQAAPGTPISLSNIPYIGATATPNEVTLSTFTNIPAGTYSVSVTSGSTTILSVAALTVREGKNYSVVARGFAPPRTAPVPERLGVTLVLHNP
ncbi:MAG: DUF4397 domain-containing protein [Gloeobacteraceae cyanobacterium ES-bin-316]|nr:DUF4397 domain-containing protein [Ferruginibacter sp.]